jgi:hypothetical protein
VTGALVLFALAGCGDMSKQECKDLLKGNTQVIAWVDFALDPVADPVVRHGGLPDGDYTWDDDLEPGRAWEGGPIHATGSGTESHLSTHFEADLTLDYRGVQVNTIQIDGPIEATFWVDITRDDVAVKYTVNGIQTISGEDSGDADQDWYFTAKDSEGGAPHYSGTIDGRSVNDL